MVFADRPACGIAGLSICAGVCARRFYMCALQIRSSLQNLLPRIRVPQRALRQTNSVFAMLFGSSPKSTCYRPSAVVDYGVVCEWSSRSLDSCHFSLVEMSGSPPSVCRHLSFPVILGAVPFTPIHGLCGPLAAGNFRYVPGTTRQACDSLACRAILGKSLPRLHQSQCPS
jgi:hypothetical protein